MEYERNLMDDADHNNLNRNHRLPEEERKIREMLEDLLTNYKKQKIEVPERDNMTLNGVEKCCLIFFNMIFMICIFPICCGFYVLGPLEAGVIMFLGKVIHVRKTAGLGWYWPIGRSIRKVSLGINTMELHGSTVPDKNGSPLRVSAIVTYKVNDPVASLYNVDHYIQYIKDQGLEVLKRVVSRFPYRSNDENVPSLLDDTMIIGKCMKELLQAKSEIAGVDILRMELMEFSYHKEVAQSLLQIQQAQAKIEARKLIVEGGVLIVRDALVKLEEENVELNETTKQLLTKDLMLITCSEGGQPTPVLNV